MRTDSLEEAPLAIDLHGFVDALKDQLHWTKTPLKNLRVDSSVDERQHFLPFVVPTSSPSEREAFFRDSAATARASRCDCPSCAFSSALNICTSLRLSIFVMQRAKMSIIRFSASVARANFIIEAMGSSACSPNWVAKSLPKYLTRSNALRVQRWLRARPAAHLASICVICALTLR